MVAVMDLPGCFLARDQLRARTTVHATRCRLSQLAVAIASTWLTLGASVAANGGTDSSNAARLPADVRIATVEYKVPTVRLIRDDGHSVSLPEEMNDGRPVVLNFIFTSCSSVCPLMSQVFGQFQQKLGSEREKVHLMSISIDPEEDTPARLREYARKFHAGPEWQHYTGTIGASVAAQRAFNVYLGDKMNHAVVTLLRAAPGEPWRRIEGFVTPDQLLTQYRSLMGAPRQSVASR
jgi:protein SCO1/2